MFWCVQEYLPISLLVESFQLEQKRSTGIEKNWFQPGSVIPLSAHRVKFLGRLFEQLRVELAELGGDTIPTEIGFDALSACFSQLLGECGVE